MKFTVTEIVAARDTACGWSAEDIADAMGRRFPGRQSIDAGDLVASWLSDRKLSVVTLRQCALLARKLTGIRSPQATLKPRACLETIAATLAAPPTETTDNA